MNYLDQRTSKAKHPYTRTQPMTGVSPADLAAMDGRRLANVIARARESLKQLSALRGLFRARTAFWTQTLRDALAEKTKRTGGAP